MSVFLLEPNKEALEEEGKEAPRIASGLLKLLLPVASGAAASNRSLFYLSGTELEPLRRDREDPRRQLHRPDPRLLRARRSGPGVLRGPRP